MITLTPEQERKIKTIAQRKQKPAEAVLDDLLAQEAGERTDIAEYVAQRRAAQRIKNQRAIDLLDKWKEEDAAMTEEERDIAAEQLNTLLSNLQANRTRIGDDPHP